MVKKFTWSEIDLKDSRETLDYYAYYGKEELGYIEYYRPWKKWVWNQGEDIIMSISCLKEVCKKLEELSHKN